MKTVTYFAHWNSMADFSAGKPADVEVSKPYSGPSALCDRWAQGQAKNAAATDATTASTLQGEAQGEHAQLSPFFSQEMNAEHAFDPTQNNELLTAAEAGTGAAAGDIAAKTNDLAARTRNASGFTKSLQEQARDRDKAAAGASEGIAAQDVLGAKALNQEGAHGLQGLYGTDTTGMLDAMGQRTKDVNAEVEAGKSGWLQNTLAVANTLGNLAGGGKFGTKFGAK